LITWDGIAGLVAGGMARDAADRGVVVVFQYGAGKRVFERLPPINSLPALPCRNNSELQK
jgi:hypothetical protein